MRAFLRLPTPEILTTIHLKSQKERWIIYGERYQENRNKTKHSFEFQWAMIDGVKLNHWLMPDLQAQTDGHCSYCDKYPLMKGDESIDHFKPKHDHIYYLDVCNWTNLYVACKACQDSKLSKFSADLLRPDEINYQFNTYFNYDYKTHRIEIKPRINELQKLKAKQTIETFDFNHISHLKSRRHAFERYSKSLNPDINDFNYRFIFE